jgi:hypothetical protein
VFVPGQLPRVQGRAAASSPYIGRKIAFISLRKNHIISHGADFFKRIIESNIMLG